MSKVKNVLPASNITEPKYRRAGGLTHKRIEALKAILRDLVISRVMKYVRNVEPIHKIMLITPYAIGIERTVAKGEAIKGIKGRADSQPAGGYEDIPRKYLVKWM